MNKDLIEISRKLISFDTVSKNSNRECADYICNLLDPLGFTIHKETFTDSNGTEKVQVLASIGPHVPDGLILSGHIDTVPFANQTGWEVDPLKLQLIDGKYYGRGSCDMKVFIAQCISVAQTIGPKKLKKPLHFVFTADEEIGCLGSKRIKEAIEKSLLNIELPKRAIIGEPTSFNIVNTHKGIVHFDIEIEGVGGHSSRPDRGKNALETMGAIIEVIKEINTKYKSCISIEHEEQFPDFPYNHLHIALANGGLALNMIPEVAKLSISYRSFPTDPSQKLYNELAYKLKEFKDVSLTNLFITPGMPVSLNDELEKVLMQEMNKEKTESVSFATDAGYIKGLGIETYVCGPGDIAQAHTPNEFISENDFFMGAVHIQNICEQLLMK